MPTTKLTTEVLTAAIEGFQQQKIRIDAQIQELRAMLSGDRTEPVATQEISKGKWRKMSTAARKRIGDAQRKRWAASKGRAEVPPKTFPAKPKRKMSAAGRKAISEATKKRWAAFNAAKAATKPAVAKRATATKGTAKKTAAKKAAVKAPARVAAKKPQKKVAKTPEAAATVTA